MRIPSKIKSLLALTFFLLSCTPYLFAQFNPSLIGDAVAQGSDCFRVTPNLNGQSGAIWSPDRINMLGNFIIEFRIFLGTNDANGADGLTFVMKNSPVPLIGGLGGGMGYQGIPNSFAVEFDTWQNTSDPSFDHIAMVSGGVNDHSSPQNLAGPVAASATSINVEDGQEHDVRIEWNGASQMMKVYFDCDERLIYTGDLINQVFAGSVFSYFGFTGSTGGAANLQRVCFDYISFANDVGSLDDVAICIGDTISDVDATINGAVGYLWTPATGVSNPSIANPTFTPAVTTTYTVDIINSCGDIIQEDFTATVGSLTNAGTVSVIDNSLCEGDTTTVSSDGDTGGFWSSSDPAIATVDATGQVTSLSLGTLTISYTITGTGTCLSDVSAIDITVNASPDSGIVTALESSLCAGGTTTVSSDGDTGGSWSSSNPAVATVDAIGQVTSLSPGTVTISYTFTGTAPCPDVSNSLDITVNASSDAGIITALNTSLCEGDTTTVSSDGDAGGFWSSSDPAIATVDAIGQVTSLGPGTVAISYSVTATAPCPDVSNSLDITVNASPDSGIVTALESSLCAGGTTTVSSDGDTGGSWSSSNPAVATVDAIGQVTSLIPGTVTISYTVTGTAPCLAVTGTLDITVNTSSDAGIITALNTSLCEGGTTTVSSDGDAGGFWSSSDPAIATVDVMGEVTSLSPGTVAISYTVTATAPCPDVSNSLDITVNASPDSGIITALESSLCEGGTTTVSSDGDTGGSWSSSNPAVATVDAIGQVTSLIPGTVTISYTVAGTAPCLAVTGTLDIIVNTSSDAGIITALDTSLCEGGTTTVSSNGDTGGSWSSSNPAVATVDAIGQVTSLIPGTVTISYTVTGIAPCPDVSNSLDITVNTSSDAGIITALDTSLCEGGTTTISSDGDTGGSWSSSNPAVATVDAIGQVTSLIPGTVTISYTVTGTAPCLAVTGTLDIIVNTSSDAGIITALDTSLCEGGTTTVSSNGDTGGSWSSSDPAIATVDAIGQVTSLSPGTVTISYTVTATATCPDVSNSLDITVNAGPDSGIVTALESSLCEGGTTTVSGDGDTGGSWSSSNPAVATVDAIGQVTSLIPGTVTISYTVAGTASCPDVSNSLDITVNTSSDAGIITALETSLCEGDTTTVSSDGDTGGSWSSSDPAIATVDATGQVTSLSPGTVAISYSVTATAPCPDVSNSLDITVNAGPDSGIVTALESSLCEGGTTTVSSDGDTGGSWSSSNPAVATVDAIGQVTSLIPGTVTISYTVAGTASCPDVSNSLDITVTILPSVIATSSDTIICLGESIILSGVGANSYIWDHGVTDNMSFIPLLGTTLYTVIGTDSNGCTNSDQITITTNPLPSVTLPNFLRICAGVAESIDAGPGFSSYLWSTGETTQSIAVSLGGDYTVSVTNSDGCDTAATVSVIASDVAVILRIDVGQFEVRTNTLTAVVTGTGDYEFSLDGFVYQDSQRFNNLYPGSYTIYVRDKNGCGTVSMDAVIIGGPPFFTPNQDGYNDTWQVIAVDTIPDARIYIFDRYGKLMKQISPMGQGWDGTYNGSPMPSSDYWYLVELNGGRTFNGHFALKR